MMILLWEGEYPNNFLKKVDFSRKIVMNLKSNYIDDGLNLQHILKTYSIFCIDTVKNDLLEVHGLIKICLFHTEVTEPRIS